MQIEINISSFCKLTLSSDLNMLTHDNVECLVSKSYKNVILCIFLLPYDKWSCHMQKSFLYFYLILKWRRSVSYFYAYWKKIGKENSVSTSILLYVLRWLTLYVKLQKSYIYFLLSVRVYSLKEIFLELVIIRMDNSCFILNCR